MKPFIMIAVAWQQRVMLSDVTIMSTPTCYICCRWFELNHLFYYFYSNFINEKTIFKKMDLLIVFVQFYSSIFRNIQMLIQIKEFTDVLF